MILITLMAAAVTAYAMKVFQGKGGQPTQLAPIPVKASSHLP